MWAYYSYSTIAARPNRLQSRRIYEENAECNQTDVGYNVGGNGCRIRDKCG